MEIGIKADETEGELHLRKVCSRRCEEMRTKLGAPAVQIMLSSAMDVWAC